MCGEVEVRVFCSSFFLLITEKGNQAKVICKLIF